MVETLIKDYSQVFDMNIFIHSNQGSHYTRFIYQTLLEENGILQSMYRRGNCWDNLPQESFFGHAIDDLHFERAINLFDLKN